MKPALNDYYMRHVADGTFVSWLATDGNTIIGTSGMSMEEKPPYFGCPSGKTGLLSRMYVAKEYRRQGIAKRLLSLVVDEARSHGCGTVHITASDMGVLHYTDFVFVKNGNFMQYTLQYGRELSEKMSPRHSERSGVARKESVSPPRILPRTQKKQHFFHQNLRTNSPAKKPRRYWLFGIFATHRLTRISE